MKVGARRPRARAAGLAPAALAALLLVALVVERPKPLAAAVRAAPFAPWSATSLPAERALTGGVVELRSPASRMILVPASTFVMGSTPMDVLSAMLDCIRQPLGSQLGCNETLFSDEMPQHRVRLSAFWLDRTEVTVRDYQRCVALGRCRPVPFAQGARRFDRPSYPVSLVTWDDAQSYCRFRGDRLPTEAEFERAERGTRGRRYPWGNLYNSHASNHGRLGVSPTDAGDGFAELAPVGSFASGRTPDGFLDLAGNVAEWVEDRYATSYQPGLQTDPRGPKSGSTRVVRGGSYLSAAPWLRGAARQSADPTIRRPFVGFRCARSARFAPAGH
jgi:formylglycine-generating enzyme required for sulfatase activity